MVARKGNERRGTCFNGWGCGPTNGGDGRINRSGYLEERGPRFPEENSHWVCGGTGENYQPLGGWGKSERNDTRVGGKQKKAGKESGGTG